MKKSATKFEQQIARQNPYALICVFCRRSPNQPHAEGCLWAWSRRQTGQSTHRPKTFNQAMDEAVRRADRDKPNWYRLGL